MSFDSIMNSVRQYLFDPDLLKILVVLLVSLVVFFITRRYLLRLAAALIKKSKTRLDDVLLEKEVFKRLAYFVPAVIIYNFSFLFGSGEPLVKRILTAYGIWIFVIVIGAILSAWEETYGEKELRRGVNLKSYIQISKIVLYILATIIIIAVLIGQSPFILLSGIGAMTAVLLLIFRDTILSFIASLQITSYNLVKVGDWIEVPKYNADGDVIEIALHTVKIQNWDKTITVIPTYKLIEESFKNWRGMSDSGGRRIKRAIYIDMTSIKLCSPDMLERFRRIQLIRDFLAAKEAEIENYNLEHKIDTTELVNGRRLTNVGILRAYIKAYLREHPKIHNSMTFLVRQLKPDSNGLPIEIYVFSNDTEWVNYEDIQSDIFDHILAVVPRFDLKVFQNPSGSDFQKLVK